MTTLRRRILSGIVLSSFEKTGVHVLSLASFFLIVHMLSLKDFGFLNLLFTVVSPGSMFVLFGMDRLIVADVATYRASHAYAHIVGLLREYTIGISFLLVLLFASAWIFKESISHYYVTDLTPYYWALVCLIVAQVFTNLASILFEAYERFDLSLATKAGESVLRTAIIVSFFLWIGFSLQSVLWAYVAAKGFTAFVSVCLAVRILLPAWRITQADDVRGIFMRTVRKHGKWEIVSSFALATTDNTGPWIVNHFVSAEGVALVTFAQKVASLFSALFPVRATLFPILSYSLATSKELAVTIATKVKKYTLLLVACVYLIVYALISPVLTAFAPHYAAASLFIQIAMLRVFIDVFTLGQSAVLYGLKKQKLNFVLSLLSAGVALISQIVCTVAFGAIGIVLSSLIVSFFNGVFREYILVTRLKFTLLDWHALIAFDMYDRKVLESIKSRLFRF